LVSGAGDHRQNLDNDVEDLAQRVSELLSPWVVLTVEIRLDLRSADLGCQGVFSACRATDHRTQPGLDIPPHVSRARGLQAKCGRQRRTVVHGLVDLTLGGPPAVWNGNDRKIMVSRKR
jgi:hypothetical protein